MPLTLNPKAMYNLCVDLLKGQYKGKGKGISLSVSADPDKVFVWIANLFRKGRS